MTFKVLKSQIGADFAAKVAAHAEQLRVHEAHMANVRADEDKPAEERAHEAYPPPATHPLVDAAVRRDPGEGGATIFVEDYVVEDDGPTPEEALRAKKHELFRATVAIETSARDAVIPPAKVRLRQIEVADAKAKSPEDRDDADRRTIADAAERAKKLDAINRHGAMLHAEIEDLTAETVDGWKPREFPR